MRKRSSQAAGNSGIGLLGRAILIFIIFVPAYWLLESLIHAYFLETSSFGESFLRPGPHELWQRLSAAAIILASLTACTRLKLRLSRSEWERKLMEWKDTLISENISELMVIYDRNFFIKWVNKSAASSLNMATSELVGKRCYELWHKRSEPCEICPVIKAMETGKPQESFVSTYDGRHWFIRGYPIFADDGTLEGAAEITLEITKLKETEREAMERGARLEAILKSVSDGVAMADQRGIITYVNSSFERILNVSKEEAIGKHINHLIFMRDPNRSSRVTVPISRALSLGHGESVVCKGALKVDGGSSRFISVSCSPILSADTGEAKGLVISISDITQNERALESFLKEKKSSSMVKFALGIAHELNNIIHSISSNLSLLRTELKLEEGTNELVTDIDAATARLKALSEELRSFAAEEKPEPVRVPPADIISQAVDDVFKESRLTVTQTIEKGIPPVEVDREKLTRSLEAILSFVRESSTKEGLVELSVATKGISEGGEILLPPGDYTTFSIKTDQYIVPKDMVENLFDPYSTFPNSKEGLKLSIANSIIESHGGYIDIHSSLDDGTEFVIYLPVNVKTTEVASPIAPVPAKAEGRILAMDDDDIVRKALKKILEFYGYEVTTASTGEEAVERYSEALASGKRFDAAIIDLTVKHGMGGRETCERILEIDKKARLIISSGYKGDEVMVDFRRYGFKAAIPKPYKAETLNRILSEVLSTEAPIG